MALLEFDPSLDFRLLLAVPLIPLVGYVVNIFFGKQLPGKGGPLLTGGMFVVMCITVYLAAKAIAAAYAGEEFFHHSSEAGLGFSWFYQSQKDPGSALNVTAWILYDPLGASMLAVVGIVSFFVHLFSMGYMHGDRRYHIFFANISLFTFAMLGLVLADNILFLFIFWELMGLMSYLLIGHFGHDPDSPRIREATSACKKAFLTTRVGDVCLFVGMMMFFYHFQTFRFTELWASSAEAVAANGGEWPAWMTVAGLFIFGGTVGKSAQFPLHIWLPDAMEGPTPVSAMIHAATMVAAGVFLLGRTYPMLSPEVLAVVTSVGALTAIFAATIGLTVFDIKGVLAYSTISQLGFMVAAIGTGGLGVVAGLFHMVTHAFFKACLFLSAGSVIHGCHHEQDMRKMGGLRKKMPITFAAMFACTLAIAGIPLFSGFYSKDKIIQAAFLSNSLEWTGPAAFASFALPVAAALTAFYMFRLIFMTFFGQPRDYHVHDHAHESPRTMTISLVSLATLGVLGGHFWLAGDPLLHHSEAWFTKLVSLESLYPGIHLSTVYGGAADVLHTTAVEHAEHAAHNLAMYVSLLVAGSGILFSWLIYNRRVWDPARIAAGLGEIYTTVANKYYVDEFVNSTVVRGTMVLASTQRWIDENVVDGVVNGVGKINRWLGFAHAWFDRTIVDGAVNGVGMMTQTFGSIVRLFQTGRVQQYVTFAVAGGLFAAAWLILST